jgi:hypothetical protein
MSYNYHNHVDDIFFLGYSHHYLFCKQHLSCILMRIVVDFMFNGIVDKNINKWWNQICLFFRDPFCYQIYFLYHHQIGPNSIHCYLIFVFKFVVWIVRIQMATLLGMSWFIALTINHICLPPFVKFSCV